MSAPHPTATHRPDSGFRYAPGLDGIRALAVAAVVSYHLGTTSGLTVLPGGFLGVDIFFVLSGYLITTLLVVEVRQRGRISIKNFYLRRARRLLPALFSVLLAVGLVGAYWLPELGARLRGDLLAALGYATNWWLIAQNSSYFGNGTDRPDLLTHLWSLAVEEQYYLIWPLVLMAFAAVKARRGVMITILLAGVAASAVAAAMLYDPYSDPSRVYYGTDTRALAPLLGATLAIVAQPWRQSATLNRWRRRSLDLLGGAALLGLGGIAWVLHDTDEELYLGGFLVIALLGAALVGVGGHPGTRLGRLLGTQPLRWLGERSYAVYLWHWPVFVLTRPGIDIPLTGWVALLVRIAAVLLLAEVSYWVIERPIRRDGFLGLARQRPRRAPHARRSPWPAVRAALLTAVLLTGGGFAGAQLTTAKPVPAAGGPVDAAPDVTLGPDPIVTPVVVPAGSPSATPTATRPPVPKGAKVVFFGDSQGMTLLLNRPADLGKYINAVDSTISGCGILLGKVASRSGERRNLSANCPNWRSEWAGDANRLKPQIAVIMVGAWDVFDLTLDSGQRLDFGTPGWDANFTAALKSGVEALRPSSGEVAISLLPCYRPIKASAGFWPERGDDDRTRHVNDLITALTESYPSGVRTLAPPVEFCTNPSIAKNTAYRWDGIHYYKKGAALYFQAVLPQLLGTAAPATTMPAPTPATTPSPTTTALP